MHIRINLWALVALALAVALLALALKPFWPHMPAAGQLLTIAATAVLSFAKSLVTLSKEKPMPVNTDALTAAVAANTTAVDKIVAYAGSDAAAQAAIDAATQQITTNNQAATAAVPAPAPEPTPAE